MGRAERNLTGGALRATGRRETDRAAGHYVRALTGADLRGAKHSGANLTGANLSGANLTGADLGGAKANQDTIWPEGFDPEAAGVTFGD